MKILAMERELPGAGPAFSDPVLRAEAQRLWELVQQSVVRESYFDAGRHAAVLVLECGDLGEAQQHLSTLPLVQAGLITFEVIPLIPYSGFARLFSKDPA